MRIITGLALGIYNVFFFVTILAGQPYPQSQIIRELQWEEQVHKITWCSGDNWPITWVNDTLQISSYGDGDGFDNKNPDLSLGFSYIIGDPPNHYGMDIRSNIDTPEGGGSEGIKTSGIIMIENTLYIFVRNYKPGNSDDFTNSRLAWSEDSGKTFQWADWHFSNTFGCPDFIQFGPNYTHAMDDFVYIVSQDNDNAYQYTPDIVLARVSKKSLIDRDTYEFYAGKDQNNNPEWSVYVNDRKSIFYNAEGTQRISVSFHPVYKRFILVTSHQPEGDNRTHTAALGVFESEFPWGDWHTVYYNDQWSGQCRTYHHKFPVKWMREDGKEMWLLFSGLDCGYYHFCLRKAKIISN